MFILPGLNIVEQSLWRAVPHYLRRVSNALKKVFSFILWLLDLMEHILCSMFFNITRFGLCFVPPAHWEVTSIDLHTNKVWILDGR